jgi:NADPH:quinone reductase-like Zn-dependent oxidoreductase
MKAVGVMGPDFMPHLFDIDEPTAAPGGVVVEVTAASVNDFDRAAIHGRNTSSTGQRDPVLLGCDFVGRVTAVAADVDYIDVGMVVAGTLAPEMAGKSGTFTDMVAVPAGSVAPVPDGVDLAQVAAVGLAGVAAVDAISALGAARLGNLVIQGPVSEVGGFALQLAKARGAVVAVITPASQVELAWALGADAVIAQGPDPTRSIEAVRDFFGGGADSAIHVAGDLSVAAGLIRPGGKFTSVADTTPPAMRATGSDADYVSTIVAPNGHQLADLLFKVTAYRLHSHVGQTLSFDQICDAFNPASNAKVGRTVLVRG